MDPCTHAVNYDKKRKAKRRELLQMMVSINEYAVTLQGITFIADQESRQN